MLCEICGMSSWIPKTVVSDIRYNTTGKHFHVKRCKHCGVYTTFNNLKVVDGGQYYPSIYGSFNTSKTILSSKQSPKVSNIAIIKRERWAWMYQIHIDKNMKVLDIGCGAGAIGIYLKETFSCTVAGIEPNPDAAKNASKSGLKVANCKLNDYDTNERFDIIILIHVIEHLDYPLEDLNKVYNMLKPKGKVVIACPNVGSVERIIFGKYWDGWDIPRHIYHFNQKSVKHILETAGFAKISVYYENYSVLLRSISNGLYKNIPYHKRKGKLRVGGLLRLEKYLGMLLAILKSSGAMQVIACRPS